MLLLTACNLPQRATREHHRPGSMTRWMACVCPCEPYTFTLHSSDPAGIAQVELSVNGQVLAPSQIPNPTGRAPGQPHPALGSPRPGALRHPCPSAEHFWSLERGGSGHSGNRGYAHPHPDGRGITNPHRHPNGDALPHAGSLRQRPRFPPPRFQRMASQVGQFSAHTRSTCPMIASPRT